MKLVLYTDEIEPRGVHTLQQRFPSLKVVQPATEQELRQELEGAEILCGTPTEEAFRAAPKLRWIQYPGAGVDKLLAVPGVVESSVIVTNTKGVFATTLAEYALGAMLYFARGFPQARRFAEERSWGHEELGSHIFNLRGKTVGVVGLGEAGSALTARAKACAMEVWGVRARPELEAPGVDRIFPPDELPTVLGTADFVVLTLASTNHTRGLIGAQELRAMKPSAYLINVSRGAIIDEQALVHALQKGIIAGAALDVFVTEPLPPESPLWDLPNTLLTPHVAGDYQGHRDEVLRCLSNNLERYLQGQELQHQVDKARGY